MTTYTLQLNINDQTLQWFEAQGLHITLGKSVGQACDTPNIAWMVFNPVLKTTITWDQTYGLFFANTNSIQNGMMMFVASAVMPAKDAAYYSIDNSGNFQGPIANPQNPPSGSYGVQNTSQYPAIIGLQQAATSNATGPINPAPISAVAVPVGGSVILTPLTTVYIWLQNIYPASSVVIPLPTPVSVATFGAGVTTLSLTFDMNSGQFLPS